MMTPDAIRELFNGYRISRILLSALELDFFTVIGAHGKTVAQVNKACGTNLRSTEMMLNALCGLKLLNKKGDVFYNTPESLRYLDRNSGDYLSGLHHSNTLWGSWSTLTEAVKKGHTVAWSGGEKQGQEWLVPFIEAMHDRARRTSSAVIANLPLPGIQKVLDLGGGPGTYALEIARQNPGVTAFVYDLPEVIELTEKYIAREGLADRVHTLSGDFMEDWIGNDYDMIFMSAIIHSYSPDVNRTLIKKCADALKQNGMIVIQDYIMDEDRVSPVEGALFAINMLVNTDSGSTYTETEVVGWLNEAGFYEIRRIDMPRGTSQIIGSKRLAVDS